MKSRTQAGRLGDAFLVPARKDTDVPTYIVLGKYTEQGARNIDDALNRLNTVEQGIQQAGGKLVGWYMTLGEYDLATIIELPGDDVLLRLALEVAKVGNLKTTTLRAFTREEVAGIISKGN
jgi:uncharacterized protein with GYD domain